MNSFVAYQDKFAASGLRVFERAIEESRRRNQNYVSLGHVLIALDAEDGGSFREHLQRLRALHNLEADLEPFGNGIEKIMESMPKYEGKGVRIGPETKKFLRKAITIARCNQREKIEAADLLSTFLQMAPIPYIRPEQGVTSIS
jgi:ATP-dependent Clp protease ATP-binding subunit ClpA